MIPIFLYSTSTVNWGTTSQNSSQTIFYNNQVLHIFPFCLSNGVQSLIYFCCEWRATVTPICLHAPPNNMAAIDLHTSPETQNCANFTRHVLACTWELCYQELLLWEHRCWNIQLYNTKHIYISFISNIMTQENLWRIQIRNHEYNQMF